MTANSYASTIVVVFLSDAIKLYMLLVFVLFVNGNVFFFICWCCGL
jgi:hypothetical protein